MDSAYHCPNSRRKRRTHANHQGHTPAGLEARPQGGPLPDPAGSERGHARVRLKAVSTLGVAPLKTQSFRSEEVNRKTCPCPKISGSLLNPVKSTITYQSTSLRASN